MKGQAAEAPVALSFFDSARGLHGVVRSGMTLLFEGRGARAERSEAVIEQTQGGWSARVGQELELEMTPTGERADLGGITVSICRVEGRAAGSKVSGLGTAAESRNPPEWQRLDAVRAVSAVFSPELAVVAVARRPREAAGHGEELVTAALFEAGEARSPEDARISTVYDGGGRQHSAGIELWFPADEFPRRLFGTAQAGTSLELPGLVVHAGAFAWRMEGNTGPGVYELTLRHDDRDDEPAAA